MFIEKNKWSEPFRAVLRGPTVRTSGRRVVLPGALLSSSAAASVDGRHPTPLSANPDVGTRKEPAAPHSFPGLKSWLMKRSFP